MTPVRFILYILCTYALTVLVVNADARVFLLAGQSNMSGAGLYEKLSDAEKLPPSKVKIWNKGAWQELGPGFSANKGRFGPELEFGREIQKAYPQDDIYIIKKASGGTSMHKHWRVHDGGGVMLKNFLADTHKALKNLEKSKVKFTIEGMLWMQGESDAAQGKGDLYQESLTHFIKYIRKEFKSPNLPFIMGRILPTFDKPVGHGPMVRTALEQVAKQDKYVACFDTDTFERINKGHYNHNGQIMLGRTFAKYYLEIKNKF